MNIFITGATGFIGSALVNALLSQNHNVTALTRSISNARKRLPERVQLIDSLEELADFNKFDAIINLAGEPIFDRRWTEAQKTRLTDSRLKITQKLTALINASSSPPHTFISGSATGYYGNSGEREQDETAPPADNFTARLCRQWEQAAQQARTRVCLVRTGLVFSPSGGALAAILPLYRFGLGGKLGDGKQYWAWIALDDMVNGILFLLNNSQCSGAFNFVAPNPVPNAEFNRTLGEVLHRPCFAAVPDWLLKLILGERAELLLDSQNIRPSKLLAQGFSFQFKELKPTLEAMLKH